MIYLAWLVWDPDRNIFTVPFFHNQISWYGFLFALSFLFAYYIVRNIFTQYIASCRLTTKKSKQKFDLKALATLLTDRLALLVILGTVIGARLGHVFFYEWSNYREHLLDIFKIWEGGLASHGAAVGILLALIIFVIWNRKSAPEMTFLVVLDAIVIPSALVGTFIRIGNFINQEILGKPTELPWGVIFKHPLNGGIPGIPLHPVQLYEAFFYLLVFGLLFWLWKRMPTKLGSGFFAGLFFLLIFGFRFFIEYLKLPQSTLIDESKLGNMGQLLSVPFIVVGIFLIIYSFLGKRKAN